MTGIWYPVSMAPRDGTPVSLWTDDHETPPVYPVTVGYWIANPRTGLGYWRIFGDQGGRQSYVDKHVRGWKPLLRDHAADKQFPIQ
jgi:hypothetical protein